MYRLLLLFLLLFATQPAPAQSQPVNSPALGLPDSADMIMLKDDHRVTLYNANGSIWKSFVLTDDFYDKQLSPEALWPEYYLLIFKVVGRKPGYYEVQVNDKQTKYVKARLKYFYYDLWPQHVLRAAFVGFDVKTNPIRKLPSNTAAKIPYDKDENYRPKTVKGDWLKVVPVWGKNPSGWIRWRDKQGKLLIEIFYTC